MYNFSAMASKAMQFLRLQMESVKMPKLISEMFLPHNNLTLCQDITNNNSDSMICGNENASISTFAAKHLVDATSAGGDAGRNNIFY